MNDRSATSQYRQRVLNGFINDGNPWLSSGEIAERYIPDASKPTRYNLIHRLSAITSELERRHEPDGKQDYKYRLKREEIAKVETGAETPAPGRRKRYISWTQEQRSMIVQKAYLLRYGAKASDVRDALDKAQKELIAEGKLPADKYRAVVHDIASIRKMMEQLSREGYGKAAESSKLEIPVLTPTPEVAKQPPTVQLPEKPVEATQAQVAPKAPRAVDISTGALLESLIHRVEHSATKVLANAVEYGITRAFRAIMETEKGGKIFDALVGRSPPIPVQRHNPVVRSNERTRLKKVLIAGITPSEVGELNEFKEVLDLRFWWKGQATHLLKTQAKSVDMTVLMVKRLGHSDSELVTHSEAPYVRCEGFINELKDKLTEIYAED